MPGSKSRSCLHDKAFERRSRSDCVHEQVAKRIANVRFTLGPAKHEKVAIYVVNQRISNVCRIAGECLSAFILSLYYTTRRRDCHSKPEHSPASPPSSFPIVKHPASCSAHLPRRNAYSICVCIQLFRRKANPTPVAKIPAERSSTSSHSPSGVPSPVFGGVA